MDCFRLLKYVGVVIILVMSIGAEELNDYKTHECIRECIKGKTKTCEYTFTLEYYYVLNKACYDCPFNKTDCYRSHCVSTDGTSRGIVTVNRMLPGPSIHVCEGDMIIVNVVNKMSGGEGAAIHWHGIFQRKSQHMDGVAMLTQCPIPSFSTFQYRFEAENAGTHFWHAHSGMQRSDGVFGHLVVRQPKELDPLSSLYDFDNLDHAMLVNDWLVEMAANRFAWHHHDDGDNKPKSMLVNGRGMHELFHDSNTNETVHTPLAVFTVTKGKKFRFRSVSNGLLNCPIQVSIDGHTLQMVASDGNAFKPYVVDTFTIFAGERYDFILNATQEVGNYWIRLRGMADCGVKKAKQVAILRYEGASDENPSGGTTYEDNGRDGKRLNPLNEKQTDQLIQISSMEALAEDDITSKPIPDKKFYIGMDFHTIDNYHFHHPTLYPITSVIRNRRLYSPQMNHISFFLPPSPPLTQFHDIPKELFCNADTVKKNCSDEFCECVHLLKVRLNDVVEIVLVDEGVPFNANHPMHLHGHAFRVVGMDRLNVTTSLEEVMRLDAEGKLERRLNKSVLKDTVTVPDGGYSIIRFHANNPGFWFFHCHIEFHLEIGMAAVIQVGEPDEHPKPPARFPKCGNWKWTGDKEEDTCDRTSGSSASRHVFITLFTCLCIAVRWAI